MPKYPIDVPDAEGNTRMYILFTLNVLNINLLAANSGNFEELDHEVDNSYCLSFYCCNKKFSLKIAFISRKKYF